MATAVEPKERAMEKEPLKPRGEADRVGPNGEEALQAEVTGDQGRSILRRQSGVIGCIDRLVRSGEEDPN